MRSRQILAVAIVLWARFACAQYQVALPGYHFEFPRDHFNHPQFQTEWWYYTGNLKTKEGRRFGYELTFFRQGVQRSAETHTPWQVDDVDFAHLALSDLEGSEFYHTERFNRQGPGLAGASAEQMRIWNGNWQVQWRGDAQELQALAEPFALRLAMRSDKPPVVHGMKGLSQKAAGEGHASHYVSFTRLLTNGAIELDGKSFEVDGTSWMDHEFFTNSLGADEAGWDWLSLQLDDETEVMLYRLRHKDGSVDPYSSGTYVDRDGKAMHLSATDFRLEPGSEIWKSAASGAQYPVAWNVEIPRLGLTLPVRTKLEKQEITGRSQASPCYWEGAVD